MTVMDTFRHACEGTGLLDVTDVVESIDDMAFSDFDQAWVLMILSMQDRQLVDLARTLTKVRQKYRAQMQNPEVRRNGSIHERMCKQCRKPCCGVLCATCHRDERRKGKKTSICGDCGKECWGKICKDCIAKNRSSCGKCGKHLKRGRSICAQCKQDCALPREERGKNARIGDVLRMSA